MDKSNKFKIVADAILNLIYRL